MRTLYLAGMAPPEEVEPILGAEEKDSKPRPSGPLKDKLVPLDPRHGVFPNHVMTPLLSTLYHFREDREKAIELLQQQIPILLEEASTRRFNVLQMPQNANLSLDNTFKERILGINTKTDLWLVFGYWSMSSILYFLLTGEESFNEEKVDTFSESFLKRMLLLLDQDQTITPFGLPERRTPRPGVYFRLLTAGGNHAPAVVEAIRQTVESLKINDCDPDHVTRVLRCMVPLPHDEAYKNKPTGKFQNCFMLCADPSWHGQLEAPTQVFWRYMGSRVKDRMLMGEDPLK
jgi:hypothetical protein